MGIGKLYFLTTGLLLATLHLNSHYEFFDGSWHRYGPKAKVRRERKKKEKKEQSKKDVNKLAKDLGRSSKDIERELKHERERTAPYYSRPDTPFHDELHARSKDLRPRKDVEKLAKELGRSPEEIERKLKHERGRSKTPFHDELRARSTDRSHKSSYDRRDSVRSKSKGRRDRRDSTSSFSSSSSVSTEYDPKTAPRRHGNLKGPVKRYRPAPFSEFVPEENFAQYSGPNPPWSAPLHPQHGTRHDFDNRTPRDFAGPLHQQPGHKVSNSDYQAYKHLFGAYDDQRFPDV